jgi:hypothetical protein
MSHHVLKCWPGLFDDVVCGEKRFEVRRNDRGFDAGDVLQLREWRPDTRSFSGRVTHVRVTYILHTAPGLQFGFVVMGIEPCEVPFDGTR